MDFMATLVLFLVIIIIVVVVLLVLPSLSGVGSYKYQKPRTSYAGNNNQSQESSYDNTYQGYISPEELKRREQEKKQENSIGERLKKAVYIDKESAPLKFSTGVTGQNNTIRRRVKKTSPEDRDPSAFDYDIDELIVEEAKADVKDQIEEAQARRAKSQQELEELI